jgi:hypothetical protein
MSTYINNTFDIASLPAKPKVFAIQPLYRRKKSLPTPCTYKVKEKS